MKDDASCPDCFGEGWHFRRRGKKFVLYPCFRGRTPPKRPPRPVRLSPFLESVALRYASRPLANRKTPC